MPNEARSADNDKCKGLTGIRCHFEPRYHESGPTTEQIKAIGDTDMASWHKEDAIEAIENVTYLGEVCTSCGKFVEAPKAAT